MEEKSTFLFENAQNGVSLNHLLLKNGENKKNDQKNDGKIKARSQKFDVQNGEATINEKVVNGQKQTFIDIKQPKAIEIHRIPFTHTCQIGDILKLLRQQVVFNQLYESCFFTGK